MRQIFKRTGAFFLSFCLFLSVWGILTPLPTAAATSGEYGYSINDDGTAKITNYNGSSGNVTIPRTLDGHTVTKIDAFVFEHYTKLTSVTIPDSVTTIGQKAFEYCTKLTSITIPDSVTKISNDVFNGCTGLTSVNIGNGVTSIGEFAFLDCTALTSITIPDSVTEIGGCAFWRCTGLTSVNIGDSVTGIDSSVFSDTGYYNDPANWKNGVLYIDNHLIKAKADELPTVYSIRPGIKTIADDAFKNCSRLTSVTIPDSATEIGDEVFRDCTELASVTIPNSVTKIGSGAFEGCTKLTDVYYEGSLAEWENINILGSDNLFTNATIHTASPVPSSSFATSSSSVSSRSSVRTDTNSYWEEEDIEPESEYSIFQDMTQLLPIILLAAIVVVIVLYFSGKGRKKKQNNSIIEQEDNIIEQEDNNMDVYCSKCGERLDELGYCPHCDAETKPTEPIELMELMEQAEQPAEEQTEEQPEEPTELMKLLEQMRQTEQREQAEQAEKRKESSRILGRSVSISTQYLCLAAFPVLYLILLLSKWFTVAGTGYHIYNLYNLFDGLSSFDDLFSYILDDSLLEEITTAGWIVYVLMLGLSAIMLYFIIRGCIMAVEQRKEAVDYIIKASVTAIIESVFALIVVASLKIWFATDSYFEGLGSSIGRRIDFTAVPIILLIAGVIGVAVARRIGYQQTN